MKCFKYFIALTFMVAIIFTATSMLSAQSTDVSNVADYKDSDTSSSGTVDVTDQNSTDLNVVGTKSVGSNQSTGSTDLTDDVTADLEAISGSINIINSQTDSAANLIESEVQTSISSVRNTVDIKSFEPLLDAKVQEIDEQVSSFKREKPRTSRVLQQLGDNTENTLEDIEELVKKEAGVDVDLTDNILKISETVREVTDRIVQQEEKLAQRSGLDLYNDSDNDGVSDYDEVNIYGTDPDNPRTSGSEFTDGERILRGLDPLTSSTNLNVFDDPRQTGRTTNKVYSVENIEVVETAVKEDKEVASQIKFEGRALPNSFVTLYIFSTPVVVTIKSDNSGLWSYVLDRELDDGNHEMYVATVNNTGRILAKSDSVPFVKQAAAVQLGAGSVSADDDASFFSSSTFIVALIILLVAVIAAIVIIGVSSARKKEGSDQENNILGVDEENNV